MIFNLIILYFKSLINHIYLPWVMYFDICLFIHFSTWVVVVEKSFHSIFNMAEYRRKPAVLVIFLRIKHLLFVFEAASSCGCLAPAAHLTLHPGEQVLPHSHPNTPLPRVGSGTAPTKRRPHSPSHTGDQGCGCTSPVQYLKTALTIH